MGRLMATYQCMPSNTTHSCDGNRGLAQSSSKCHSCLFHLSLSFCCEAGGRPGAGWQGGWRAAFLQALWGLCGSEKRESSQRAERRDEGQEAQCWRTATHHLPCQTEEKPHSVSFTAQNTSTNPPYSEHSFIKPTPNQQSQ